MEIDFYSIMHICVEKECQVYILENFSLRLDAAERAFEGILCDLFEYDGMIKTSTFIS
jgi:hypothetical protein